MKFHLILLKHNLCLTSSRVKSAVQSNGGGKISLSFDYVIAADSSSSVGLGVNIPISELNSTSL